jgi:DNA-binding transcriptional MerR regulator
MLSIGDFSKIAKVSVKTLRHYDQIGLFKPGSVDYITGYRKYSILQLTRLNKILFYKELGFSLKEIFELVEQEITTTQMLELLHKNSEKLKEESAIISRNLDSLQNRIDYIRRNKAIPSYDIKLIEGQTYHFVSRKMIIPTVKEITFYSNLLYESLYQELDAMGIQSIPPEFNLYHDKEYKETDLEVEFGVSIEGTKSEQIKLKKSTLLYRKIEDKHLTLSLKYTGNLKELDTPIIEMIKWIEENNLEIDGDLRELHLSGKAHVNGKLQKNAAAELQFPVKK